MKMSLKVNTDDLKTGMILGEDICCNENLLLSKGMVLKQCYVKKLMARGIMEVAILADKTYYDDIFLNPVEKFYVETYEALTNVIERYRKEDKIEISRVFPIVENILEAVFSSQNSILSLTGFRGEGDYFQLHALDVCIYSLIAAKVMNLSYEDTVILGFGALLHDIGKTRVPDRILNKKGKLTDEEFDEVKKHSECGYQILIKCPQINSDIVRIVLQHHERCDGSGYPNNLKDRDIHLLSKIVAIADIYDALTSDRVYRKKVLPHEAAEYLLCISNTLIDPHIAKVFVNNIAIYPKGCQVLLSNNQVAFVIDSNPKMPLRPVLKIITDKFRNPLPVPYEFSLQDNSHIVITQICC
ncbi:putative nucleotidyltransferase with HDIG domain [Ruminiclostridium sufflavum DSM 19573]|uniref:Putative nucleotidyltransferase with HDIG domain n=1 Tax=Ruminiclostridium sufflavum DSM 19573 TaxID=1121337 RepID=A0A318XJ78_9FIRM|nr:HD-GYP domain-containing protein [Ruminiclostridium sufflavum]PYG87064.1 putative nucleotidyltransferase with HDIG domain [Ruminiclostridium sufflavum DSM 19573]